MGCQTANQQAFLVLYPISNADIQNSKRIKQKQSLKAFEKKYEGLRTYEWLGDKYYHFIKFLPAKYIEPSEDRFVGFCFLAYFLLFPK